MAVFKRRPVEAKTVPPMGSGRRLRTALDAQGCVTLIDQLSRSYREPPYPKMPSFIYPGWRWLDSSVPQPQFAACCTDENDDFMLFTFWPGDGGTEMGLFPLGSSDERLQALPIIGNWKMRDPSLSSTGTWPARLLVLQAPHLADDYFPEILATAGFPATPVNLAALTCMIHRMFLIKAGQALGSVDERAAGGFVDSHLWFDGAGPEYPQQLLHDLAAAAPEVLPYIQDLPWRVRAILLQSVGTDEGFLGGSPAVPLSI